MQAVVYPLEVVRTQVAVSSPALGDRSLWGIACRLCRNQGPSALYRGIKPSLVCPPTSCTSLGIPLAFGPALLEFSNRHQIDDVQTWLQLFAEAGRFACKEKCFTFQVSSGLHV
jgi:hypothetical protein